MNHLNKIETIQVAYQTEFTFFLTQIHSTFFFLGGGVVLFQIYLWFIFDIQLFLVDLITYIK